MVFGFLGGGGAPKPPLEQVPSDPTPSRSSSDESQYRFNSDAIERAAKAAKDLEKSPHAKQLLELQKTAEITRQLELQKNKDQIAIQLEKIRQEEQRITDRQRFEQQAQINKQKSQYDDQLARHRYEDQIAQQKAADEEKFRREKAHLQEQIRRQAEATAQQEELKRRNIDYEIGKKTELEMKRIEADYKARAVYERENVDIHMKTQQQKAEEFRATVLDSIKNGGAIIGQGFNNFITDWNKIRSTAIAVTLFAGGLYAAKHSVGIAARTIEARIGKPSLTQETTRLNAIDMIQHPIKCFRTIRASRRPEDALKNVVLRPEIEEELRDVAIATRNTKINGAEYRNFMFYGPPGTGKTLFAKRLAQHSGMDFAMMSGGNVAPLGKDAVTEIHKIFDWSQTSRRGLLLFIDEAEGFLSRRAASQSEGLRQVVDAFLNRTGEQSNKYMFILSTNLPQEIDEAVVNRIHREIKFELPTLDERKRLIRLYFDKYVLEPAAKGSRRGIKVEQFDYGALCDKIATMTEGLSARGIMMMVNAMQADAFARVDRLLTQEMIMKIVKQTMSQHSDRVERQSNH